MVPPKELIMMLSSGKNRATVALSSEYEPLTELQKGAGRPRKDKPEIVTISTDAQDAAHRKKNMCKKSKRNLSEMNRLTD